jgi:hemerythrin-like domain-containing protein
MLEATRLLEEEHRVIERAIPMMERVDGIGEGDAQVLEFFRNFVDACHHRKEETILFPALEARGVPRSQGLIRELLQEHGAGRRMLRDMGGLLHPAQDDFGNSRLLIRRRGRDYVALLRKHIAKEEAQLWPLAERVLTPDDDANIAVGYEDVDQTDLGISNYKRYLAWTRQWAA